MKKPLKQPPTTALGVIWKYLQEANPEITVHNGKRRITVEPSGFSDALADAFQEMINYTANNDRPQTEITVKETREGSYRITEIEPGAFGRHGLADGNDVKSDAKHNSIVITSELEQALCDIKFHGDSLRKRHATISNDATYFGGFPDNERPGLMGTIQDQLEIINKVLETDFSCQVDGNQLKVNHTLYKGEPLILHNLMTAAYVQRHGELTYPQLISGWERIKGAVLMRVIEQGDVTGGFADKAARQREGGSSRGIIK